MRKLSYINPEFNRMIDELCDRTAINDELDLQVREILCDVHENGDAAVAKYANRFDDVNLTPDEFSVSEDEITTAGDRISAATRDAVDFAFNNIIAFSKQSCPESWDCSPRDGVLIGERFVPLRRVGAYIPGGTTPLISTVLHTVTLAYAAGVEEIAVTTPVGSDKVVHPAILYAASLAGVREVYRLGGVYAIAAMAYGTESVSKVDKIVGPGNAYVAAAKRLVYGQVSLDLVAGPSEVMIIADDTAKPAYIAADMLAQAEHGSGHELAVLVTTSSELVDRVVAELESQSNALAKKEVVKAVLERGVTLVHTVDLNQAIEVANKFAPEHLEIITADCESIGAEITTAGALFLGPWTPEPVGDFVAGPSHVLPTSGTARFFSGLTVSQFYRRMSVIQYTQDALRRERSAIEEFASIESLEAHRRSIHVRFDSDSSS